MKFLAEKYLTLIRKRLKRQRKEQEMEKQERRGDDLLPRTSYGRSTRSPQDQMVKVLTSATFIRGVFGILKKVMK